MKKNKVIYLSAPISGYDLDERRAMFQRKEDELVKRGYTVLNPMKNGLDASEPTTHHMKRDIVMLLQADAILLLTNWNRSAGCLTELHVATAIGLEVLFDDIYTI